MRRLPTLALLLLIPGAASAQARAIGPAPSRLFAMGAEVAPAVAPDTLPKIGDHRVTGTVIGGVLGGTLGFLVASSGSKICTTDYPSSTCPPGEDDEILEKSFGVLAGAAVGAGLGYLMGKSTPKAGHVTNVAPVEPIKDTGMPAATGTLVGAAVGAASFLFLDAASKGGDGEPPVLALSFGALVGAFVGYGIARE